MLKTIIIEDEKPAMEMLVQALAEADADVQVDQDFIERLHNFPDA